MARGKGLKRTRKRQGPTTAIEDYRAELDAITPALELRSHGKCELDLPGCKRKATVRHHRKLRSQGGPNTLANLLQLCAPSHDHLHAHPRIAYTRGWLVPMGSDPDGWPVRHG